MQEGSFCDEFFRLEEAAQQLYISLGEAHPSAMESQAAVDAHLHRCPVCKKFLEDPPLEELVASKIDKIMLLRVTAINLEITSFQEIVGCPEVRPRFMDENDATETYDRFLEKTPQTAKINEWWVEHLKKCSRCGLETRRVLVLRSIEKLINVLGRLE